MKNLFNNNAQNAVSNLKIKILRVAQDGRMTFWQLISQPLCESQAAQLVLYTSMPQYKTQRPHCDNKHSKNRPYPHRNAAKCSL